EAWLDHAEVPASAPAILHTARHVRHVEANVQFPTRLTALTDRDQRRADPPAVTEAEIGLVGPLDHKVFAKRAGAEAIGARRQIADPFGKMRHRIGVDGLV